MPWPPRSTELRRIDWSDYLQDPEIGLLVDPATGEPFGNVITVRVRILDRPPIGSLEQVEVGETTEIPLAEYLTAETQRADLGRIPWAQLLEFKVVQQPPPLDLPGPRESLPKDFEGVKKFLFEILEKDHHLVLLPGSPHVGVSRRIEEEEERERLRTLLENLRPEHDGLIVRTAGEFGTDQEFERDLAYLTQLWQKIHHRASRVAAPAKQSSKCCRWPAHRGQAR